MYLAAYLREVLVLVTVGNFSHCFDDTAFFMIVVLISKTCTHVKLAPSVSGYSVSGVAAGYFLTDVITPTVMQLTMIGNVAQITPMTARLQRITACLERPKQTIVLRRQ